MKEDFNESRRKFIKNSFAFGAGATVLPKFLKKENRGNPQIPEVNESMNPEAMTWPEEKYIPVLMRNYMSKYNSWVEVGEQQKNLLIIFMDKMPYKQALIDSAKKYLHGKNDGEIENLVQEIINKRKSNLSKVKLKFNPLSEDFGQYDKQKNQITVDTTSEYMQIDYKERFTAENAVSMNLTTLAHELWHAIHDHYNYTFVGEIMEVYEALEKSKLSGTYIAKEEIKERKKKIKANKNGIVTDMGMDREKDRGCRPTEIQSYMLQVRMLLSIVCDTNKNLPVKFNMLRDRFTMEHLDFLLENNEKIFGVDYEKKDGQKIKNNTLLALLRRFDKQTFVEMMNKVV